MTAPPPALKEFLEKTPFFGGLDDGGLDRVASMLVAREVKAGGHVFSEGDTGRSMYIVHHGDLVVYRRGESGASVKLMHLGVGDFFGETTLIEMQPRPTTVLAVRDALLYELTNMSFYKLYHEDVKAYVMVLQNMNRELCRRLRKAEARVIQFADDAHDERTQIVSMPTLKAARDADK
jgi:CRP/FNR family transcriptional regulator, cyclic AMP receptor protein